MGQSLFKKHSKFQNFDEIFYCGITRFRSTNLDVFIPFQYTSTISITVTLPKVAQIIESL